MRGTLEKAPLGEEREWHEPAATPELEPAVTTNEGEESAPSSTGSSLAEPLDATSIKTIKQRFLRVNRERLKRVRQALNAQHREFFDLLPLLFHINYPLLPGFVSKSTPFGVSEYTPTNAGLAAAKRVARSFEFKRRAARSVDIHSLLLMGSSGTVAYSRTSDFDIWVCHRPDLSQEELVELQRKTDSITLWADSLGLEVHFFNLSADAFRSGHVQALSSESSGSAQHYLLLDEFYRTGLLLAGRYPVWWLVPPALESNYREVVETIRARRLVHEREFLDFGTVSDLPASEFVGAALWQLTKAIASPHKSLLKIMLLEAYANEYPTPDLLSMRYKRAVYAGERSLNALDPYMVFVRKVEDYLLAAGDDDRVELARKCFYLKVNVPLSRIRSTAADDWRSELVREVVTGWQWEPEKVASLDARPSWKIDRVMAERKAMVRALTHTYKLITRFGRERSDAARVSERDMTILGRKLFAAFENKAGKVEIVNRESESDLSEMQLTVVRARARDGHDSWLLHRGAPNADDRVTFKRSSTLVELLAWCYFNGVLSRNTRMSVQQADVDVSSRDVETLHSHLRSHFPLEYVRIPDVEDLARPPELLAASTFVNLGIDPMATYTRQGKRLTSSHADALSYGGLHENLIAEVDYLLINTWREVLTLRYHGMQGLLDCLAEHLGWVRRAKGSSVPSVPCNCFTPGYAHAITRRISRLFEDVTAWYQSSSDVESKLYILKGEDQFYALWSEKGQVRSDYIGPMTELMRYLGRPRESYTAVTADPFALQSSPLDLVFRNTERGKLSCAYLVNDSLAHVFIVDENGALFHDRIPFHSDTTLVRNLQSFFSSVQYRQSSGGMDEAALDEEPVAVTFYRIEKTPDHIYKLRTVEENGSAPLSSAFNVQVIGERIDGETQFTLYCDQREFSTLDHGESVFEALAEHILQKRAGRGRYPIFITDIDLSQLETESASGRRLQTIHYLHYKKRIEDRLNEIVLSDW